MECITRYMLSLGRKLREIERESERERERERERESRSYHVTQTGSHDPLYHPEHHYHLG